MHATRAKCVPTSRPGGVWPNPIDAKYSGRRPPLPGGKQPVEPVELQARMDSPAVPAGATAQLSAALPAASVPQAAKHSSGVPALAKPTHVDGSPVNVKAQPPHGPGFEGVSLHEAGGWNGPPVPLLVVLLVLPPVLPSVPTLPPQPAGRASARRRAA